ncbi:MAG: hypothetical protein OHM57_08280 [Spiroplasma phoeniceum]|nr:MAG: hypothetical protein OHM57_08280 [Spiroplasma phoeniceum]
MGYARSLLYPTLRTKRDRIKVLINYNKWRYLNILECILIMGYSKNDLEKMLTANSVSQISKQLGNYILPNVLKYIFLQLIKENENEN